MKEYFIVFLLALTAVLGISLFFKAESEEPEVQQKDSVRTVVVYKEKIDTVLLLKKAEMCTLYIEVEKKIIPEITANFDTVISHNDGCKDSLDIIYYLRSNMFRIANKHIGVVKEVETTIYKDNIRKMSLYPVFEVSKGKDKFQGEVGFDAELMEQYLLGIRVNSLGMLGISAGYRIK